MSRFSSIDARNSVTSFISAAELPRLLRILRIVLEQLVVFLQRRTAARGIGDDGVEAAVDHRIDIAPRQLARLVAHPGVDVQRAAAASARRAPPLRSRSSAARAPWLRSAARKRRWRCSPPSSPRGSAARLRPEMSCRSGRRRMAAPRAAQAAPGAPAFPTASASPSRAPLSASRSPDTGTAPRRRQSASRRLQQLSEDEIGARTRASSGRRVWFSISARAASTSRPYCTPDGHALSQARQARHRSMCSMYDVRDRRARRPPAPSGRCARAANPSRRPARDRSGRRSDTGRSVRSGRGPPVAVGQRRR